MEFEHNTNPGFTVEPDEFKRLIGGIVQSDIYQVWERLIFVTGWLQDQGVPPETIMCEYFNELIRIATSTRGVWGSYVLASQLYWHLVKIIKKLQEASAASGALSALPPDPTQATPPTR